MEHILYALSSGSGVLMQLAVVLALILWRTVRGPLKTYCESHTTVQQRQLLSQLGREAFAFAETVYADYDGPAKLNEATKYMLDKCKGCGMTSTDMQDIRAAIESAWLADRRQSGQPVSAGVSSQSGQP